MRKFRGLGAKVAYPGALGPAVPRPPVGMVMLGTALQEDNLALNPDHPIAAPFSDFDQLEYLTDDGGSLLVVEAS